jgi:hypothetical protein
MLSDGIPMMAEILRLRRVVTRSYRHIESMEDRERASAEREQQYIRSMGHTYMSPYQIGDMASYSRLEDRLRRRDELLSGQVPGAFTQDLAWMDEWDVPAVHDARIPSLDYRVGFFPVRPCRDYRRTSIGASMDELNTRPGFDSRRLVSAGNGYAVIKEDYLELVRQTSDLVAEFGRNPDSQLVTTLSTRVARIGMAALFPGLTYSFGTFDVRDGYEFQWKRLEALKGKFFLLLLPPLIQWFPLIRVNV